MKKYTSIESSLIVKGFLRKLKSGIAASPSKVEYFCLKLQKPHYERLNCAYLQTNDLKEAILYEAVTRRFFYVRINDLNEITMDELSKSVNTLFPKLLKDKMFWVCGSKADKEIVLSDMAIS